jgi:DNA-binding transcriptional MerR regulator
VTRGEIWFAIISGILVNEFCDVSPWVAVRLMRWAARLRYGRVAWRAAVRSEEYAALIQDRPGNLFKLLTALGFTVHGLLVAALRDAPPVVKRAKGQRIESGYSASDVCRLVGISYEQLDYWARTGLVTPSLRAAHGWRSHRLYSLGDVVKLRIIKRLSDAGISLQPIRQALGYLRSSSSGRPLSDVTLISDSQRIYACYSGEEVIDVLSHGQAVFGIAVGRVWADTDADVAHLPKEHRHPGRARQRLGLGVKARGRRLLCYISMKTFTAVLRRR